MAAAGPRSRAAIRERMRMEGPRYCTGTTDEGDGVPPRKPAARAWPCAVAPEPLVEAQLVRKPWETLDAGGGRPLVGEGQSVSPGGVVPVKNSSKVPGAPVGGKGVLPAFESRTKFQGFGTVWSQKAAWVRIDLAACGTLPLGLPPRGGSRFGSVFAERCPAKFTGSAGSRMVFATTRNWR